jgi:hypothetical protein
MVGGYVLRYALEHPVIGSVTAIIRRNLGISHPKLREDPVFRTLLPNQVIRADDLARAMVDVVVLGTAEGPIFENRDIRTMVQSLHPPRTDQANGVYKMLGSLIGLGSSWRRARKQLSEALQILKARGAEPEEMVRAIPSTWAWLPI